MKSRLLELIEGAEKAMGYRAHTPTGFQEPTNYTKQPASVTGLINLLGEYLPAFLDADGRITRTPRAALAGEKVRLDAALIKGSRVAAAGATIIMMPDLMKAIPTGTTGVIAMQNNPGSFVVVDPARFSTVADDADTPLSDGLPVSRAPINFDDDVVTKGFRVELDRASRRGIVGAEFEAEAHTAIIYGIARACDDLLLEAIVASTPSAFTLGAAAAEGIKFNDLRGLVGTNGTGATVNQSGELRLSGIAAELTDATSASIVGVFQQSAVAIRPDISVTIDRMSKAGDLVIQVFVDMVSLLPVPNRFWAVT